MPGLPMQPSQRIAQYAAIGAIAAAIIGGVAGLVLGLRANPATAWFAVFELAVPASIVGAFVGFIFGLIAQARRHFIGD